MRSKAGLKQCALIGLFAAALVTGACSDEEDAPANPGGSGGSGGSSSAGKSSGGSSAAGKGGTAGTASGGNPTAGTSPAGSTSDGGAPEPGGGGQGGGGGEPLGGEGGMLNGGAGGAEAGAGAGGEPLGNGGEAGAAPIVYATLVNPGFEQGVNKVVPTGWTNEGTAGAAYYESGYAHSGTGKLSHWTQWIDNTTPPYTARTYQTLDPIENGTYSFSIWVNREWADEQYLFATDYDVNDLTDEATVDTDDTDSTWVKVTLSNIPVTSGKITVGVYTSNPGGTWVGFDDAELVKE